ncbi:ABC transporter permease/M1 family aminopeptidase [Sphingomonas rubra]|uniref:ABC-type transport system involved in multi-copper enzyme maturation, permease component n=1 Tax=Sphingomonas rubra TaxID=634430 RepID=A0A1I5THF7_9SPHN|nr:M1 family aminopeptidase [Sphingomonas rubra]SFP82489.1 ABC-type transport system involved in multi-copper enzyme maturation, permease component [Sphingomonas rubra]
MVGAIARFELRYQLRNPVFWVVAILFFLLTFGSMTIDQIQIGSGGNVHKNAATALARTHTIMSIFFMFVTTAFVANVVVRDDESGFGAMVRSTRVTKAAYLLARFAGAFAAAAIAFLAVPLAIWLGSLMPWVDPETLGPNRLGDYLYAYFLLALPNLFLTAGVFFAVATTTRSMTYSYLGVIVFLVLYFALVGITGTRPEWRETVAYLEPFGNAAFGWVTRYWTAAEANAAMPAFAGVLAANRLLCLALGSLALALAYARFSFAERGASPRRLRREQRRAARLAATEPRVAATLPPTDPVGVRRVQLLARTRFEMALIFRSPGFLIMLAIGLFSAGSRLLFAGERYGTPTYPLTFSIIDQLAGAFALMPIIIAIYYAGELVWRDRERGMNEIVDATPLPNWGYLVPKTLAVAGVLVAMLLVSVLLAMAVQLFRGVTDLAPGEYLAWYVAPFAVDFILLAVLAVFIQALSPNKYVGWAVMVAYLVATSVFTTIGWEHPLYLYGATGSMPLSDMNGDAVGGARGWWLRLYWSGWALALAVAAHLLWRRGTDVKLAHRLRLAPARLRGLPGVLLAGALAVILASGAFIYRQMNVLNTYRSGSEQEARIAAYERKYLPYASLRQPTLTDIRLDVALHPAERRMAVAGRYVFVNDTGAPLRDLHLRLQDDRTRLVAMVVLGAQPVMVDRDFQYRIYRFDRPLAPGAVGTVAFRTARIDRGFTANDDDTRLVGNGSFLNNREFAPVIGMDKSGLLQDRAKRRKQGLPAELRPAKLEDRAAQWRNYVHADWVRSDITLSTDADQVPIAPGRKVADVTAGGRRTAHFVSEAPILAFFSIQSARYREAMRLADGVRLSVHYDPRHAFNVRRMLTAMQATLSYYRGNFGPYQFDYARIVEFPGYSTFAQAFAGTIPYSEKIGFIADARRADDIDYVTYVTAHELGHQYWAHQIISADMQGGTLLVESMAQYSTLMVMKHLYGPDKIRRFLKYELDDYLRGRRSEAVEEQPLMRVENQAYIHYNKGALALYLLQDRLGEDRVNRMLAALLDRYRFRGRPYPRSTDLVAGFASLARTPEERQLVADLFERIVLWDLKAKEATTRRLSDGRWETLLTIDADKFVADGQGNERRVPLAGSFDVGAFTARPGFGGFSRADVLGFERRPIRSGSQQVRIVTARAPAFVGVDPYNKYIDRSGDDNVVEVTR